MKNEARDFEPQYEVINSNDEMKNAMSIQAGDVKRTVEHLALLKDAVSQIMKKGLNHDYGIVPGAKRPCLLKPGAEKLMKIFGLGARFIQTNKEVDRYENYAEFAYKCEVYHLKTGIVVAECEGTTNSWEKKYKERAIYKDRVVVGHEKTPVMDILNMLMKMAQKRALIGAVLIATGAREYFTQDEDDIEALEPRKVEKKKVDPSKFETKKGKTDHALYIVPCGKFKDKKLVDIGMKDLKDYINHIATNNDKLEGPLKTFVDTAREYIRDSA